MKKKIIILSSLIFLFLVSLIVYTKAENSSVKNSKEGINWQVKDYKSLDYVELSDGYIVLVEGISAQYFIKKYNKDGKEIWKHNFDRQPAILATKDDGFIVYTWLDYNNYAITKYNKDGKQLWQQHSIVDDLLSVDDGLIVLSKSGLTKYSYNDGTVVWDTTNVNKTENNILSLDKVIETEDGYVALGYNLAVKYDKNGKLLWNKQDDYSFTSIEEIINTDDGYVAIVKEIENNKEIPSIVKYDKNGNLLWGKQDDNIKFSEIVDVKDGYVAVGENKTGDGDYVASIVKFGKDGKIIWNKEYQDRSFSQILVNEDEYIVGGIYNKNVGTLFISDKNGNLTDYKYIATGRIGKLTTNNFKDYIVLTSHYLTSYSIDKEKSPMDDSGIYVTYKVGDEVEYNDIKYYTIEDSDSNQEYVTLLKAENLTSDEINKYKGDIQVTENGVPFYTNNECYWNSKDDYKENGCWNYYGQSFVQKIIENWASDALKKEDLAKVGGYKARSISIDELINNLGYYYEFGTPGTCLVSTLDTPEWVYNTSPYWTMSGYDDSNTAYSVSLPTKKTCNSKTYNEYGIRPVINLKKIAIEGSKQQENKQLVCKNGYHYEKQTKYKEFNTGDEVEYNGENYYVIEDSDNKTKYITLLKDEPLTAEEVNKYNGGEYESKDGEMPYRLGCDSTHLKNCINLYDESLIKKVVDNWSGSFDKDLVKVDGYKVRLITFDEILDNLEYVEYPSSPSDISYEVTDNWMYNNNYSYWTMSGYEDSTSALYVIKNTGVISKEWSVLGTNFVRPVINLDKCAVDGGCYEENVAIGCKDDKTVVNVPSTLKMASKILLIISSILIIGGIGLITFNYIKARRERK